MWPTLYFDYAAAAPSAVHRGYGSTASVETSRA